MNTTIVFRSAMSIEVRLSTGRIVYVAIPHPITGIGFGVAIPVSDFINNPKHPFYALNEILTRANMQVFSMMYTETPANRVDCALVSSERQLFVLQACTPGLALSDEEQ